MEINNADQLGDEVDTLKDSPEPAGDPAGDAGGGGIAPEGLTDMAMSTSPSPPLESVESPWDPERGGPSRLMRASQKAFNTDGLPAGLEAIIGIAEIYVGATATDSTDSTADGTATAEEVGIKGGDDLGDMGP